MHEIEDLQFLQMEQSMRYEWGDFVDNEGKIPSLMKIKLKIKSTL